MPDPNKDPFALDPKVNINEAERLTLGGRTFYVPILAFRQVAKITAHCGRMQQFTPAPKAVLADAEAPAPAASTATSEEDMLMLAKLVHLGLTRAHPWLCFDDFIDLPISLAELTAAAPAVLRQTHLIATATEPGKASAAGN